jgi:ABC-2 type transport system ATP-binding protein
MDVIKIEGLQKFLGSFRLGPFDLRVEPGAIVGVIGNKDAGKTTLLRLLWGFSRPDKGLIEVFGMKPHLAQMEIRRRAGYVAEHTWYYPDLSVGYFLKFIGNFYPKWDETRIDSLLKKFDIEPDMKIGFLSLSGRRNLCLIAALGHWPSLLILDEPTAGLDDHLRDNMLNFLRRLSREDKVTIVISSHVPDEFDHIADGVLTLTRGKVAECAQ